ncbi:M1 family metallopeptidase [Legionella fallonii]|uniref:Aminopeptidase N n=1 Tax=Legionella fallonii LLAP-10 TaxID=1212491 RepID=A0A098G291_9GAMM|nr:M1 family metallopeptidase [Legionella fallonii]CEG56597.1 Leukotriene-A(4) hydrolase [Legionella fallonii LLAP-10]
MRAKIDPHSYSEPEKVNITHLDLTLNPDFKNKTIQGVVEMTLHWHDLECHTLTLDTKKLNIQRVEISSSDESWVSTDFRLEDEDKILGSALHINANAKNKKVRITYETSSTADGLQWLDPSQTATKKYPYLYSHSEPINARSWMPVQDTPEVRQTYTARINTPKELRAVMSAENNPDHVLNGEFEFNMNQPIPTYLIAFAVGNIQAKKIGPRSAVFAEPDLVDKTAKEFEDTEQMIQVTEGLYGQYPWGNYDVLVMPPSFPMGGMENPLLTFATPTLIAGDKSLVGVIAHELAHSWSGNLVTNARWDDVWLNEGFTTYVQNRIVEAVYGKEQADLEFMVSVNELYEELDTLEEQDQHLVLNLDARDPHDGFSGIAYTKGAWFLKTLEEQFGRDQFDDFLKKYFHNFAFKSITTTDFIAFAQTHLLELYPQKYSMEEINQWLHQPGIPKDAVKIKAKRCEINDVVREQWLNGTISANQLNAQSWSSNEWQYFLNKLPSNLKHEQIKELDECYHLTGMSNHVVAAQWYKITIDGRYSEANIEIKNYLLNIGRRYLIVPLYQRLLKTEDGKQFAQEIYKEARTIYHSVTRETIDKKFKETGVELNFFTQTPSQAMENTTLNRYRHFNAGLKTADNAEVIADKLPTFTTN